MKRLLLYLIFLFSANSYSFAQSGDTGKNKLPKEGEADGIAVQTKMLSKNFYGFVWGVKYFPLKRVGTGVHILFSQKNSSDTFSYTIKKPVIQYLELGWTNQYNFISTSKFRLDASVINGLSVARLGDNAIKEKQHKNRPKEIASNYFYLLEPGMDFSYNLSQNHKYGGLWLTLKSNYRFIFGHANYASAQQFSGYLPGIGISIIGFDDDTIK